MTSAVLRQQLGLTREAWAHALGVNVRTVARWEDDNVDPGGLANAVMQGISSALEEGADPKRAGRLVGLGIASLVSGRLLTR